MKYLTVDGTHRDGQVAYAFFSFPKKYSIDLNKLIFKEIDVVGDLILVLHATVSESKPELKNKHERIHSITHDLASFLYIEGNGVENK